MTFTEYEDDPHNGVFPADDVEWVAVERTIL